MFKNQSFLRKSFFSIAFCLAMQSGYCQSEKDGDDLYVYTKSAKEAAVYSLDEINKITFSKKGIQIWNTNWPTEYVYSNVRILTFSDIESSSQSIIDIVSDRNTGVDLVYNPSSFMLTINSARQMSGVALYNSKGMLVLSDFVHKHKYCFLLSSLPNGIYLVKVFGNGKTISRKIVK